VNTGKYSKFIVSLLGTITSGLTIWYPGATHLVPIITMVLTSLGVVAIPNTGAAPPALGDFVAAVDQLLGQRFRPPKPPAPPAPPPVTMTAAPPPPTPGPPISSLPPAPPAPQQAAGGAVLPS
jgi:hypothetical protein